MQLCGRVNYPILSSARLLSVPTSLFKVPLRIFTLPCGFQCRCNIADFSIGSIKVQMVIMGSMERPLDDALGLVDSPSLNSMQIK